MSVLSQERPEDLFHQLPQEHPLLHNIPFNDGWYHHHLYYYEWDHPPLRCEHQLYDFGFRKRTYITCISRLRPG